MAPRRFFGSAHEPLKAVPAVAQRRNVSLNSGRQSDQLLADNLWTTEQVRQKLNLGSTDAVLRLVRDFGLPRVQLSGLRHFRYVPSQVEAWIAAQNPRLLSLVKGA